MFKSISFTNLLSFGPQTVTLPLKNLNIFIGPNGAGKSNMIEAIGLLAHASHDISLPVRAGGGIGDWIWKGGDPSAIACIEAVVDNKPADLRYKLCFSSINERLSIEDERIEYAEAKEDGKEPYFFYKYQNGSPVLNVREEKRYLKREDIDPDKSILSQRKDPEQYPEVTHLGKEFSFISIYKDWTFGRLSAPRQAQKTDLPNIHLSHDSTNLAMILNSFQIKNGVKHKIMRHLQELYNDITDYFIQINAGTAQLFLQEGYRSIPATRLSDGTLRYISLLAILCDPDPPPLICIEEPELGLHPDILPSLADLLIETSMRTQLIVTTHSDVLVDAMTERPESIIVTEKREDGTVFERLNAETLSPWLESYRLGTLWMQGNIGGTRW